MLPTRFIPHSMQFNTNAGVTSWVNQVESLSPDGGVTLFEETSGSETDRTFVAAKEISPTLPLVTSDLTVLGTVGFGGLPIAAGSSKPGVILYGRELPLEALPTAIGTAHHLTMTCSDGLMVPVALRAGHNTVAKLSLMLHAILGTGGSSGATPFVWAASQTISSGAGATSNIYCAGNVKYTSGSARLVAGIQDVGVEFGIQVLKEATDSDVYPSHVSIMGRMTRFEFTTKDVELISEVGDGLSCTAFAQYFRAVSANGQRVANATTSHVGISATAGMLTAGSTRLVHKRPGEASFVFTPALNTNLITISTTTAIPTS